MTVLTRWSLSAKFPTLQDRMNRLFRETYRKVARTNP